MIRIVASDELVKIHVESTIARVRRSFKERDIINSIRNIGINSFEEFLEATPEMMKDWIAKCPEKLRFTEFKTIYTKYFSNGENVFVHGDYNAYKFLEKLDVRVCPYCDDESLDVVQQNRARRRTAEIDHFYTKSAYPALAMCFYNLIPCGQSCNGLKMEHRIDVNPYDENIESKTFLYPDIEVGILMENIFPEECKVKFNPTPDMKSNVDMLALEQRYERYYSEVYDLLKKKQNFTEEKIQEMVRMKYGTHEEIINYIFGPQDPIAKKNMPRQKMKKDLTGY